MVSTLTLSPHDKSQSLCVCVCVSFLCVDVEFYRLWLGRYRLQHIRAMDCPSTKDLGLMLVNTTELRNQLLPSPIRCQEVIVHTVKTCCVQYFI